MDVNNFFEAKELAFFIQQHARKLLRYFPEDSKAFGDTRCIFHRAQSIDEALDKVSQREQWFADHGGEDEDEEAV